VVERPSFASENLESADEAVYGHARLA